ncbi:MAG: hypothetical protein QG623_359 [Patescibacteria group bacterium]|nr:hypothetical protein [Patescibacteria group bacterium]
MTKIHAAFERIPDEGMAEAASDWVLTNGYKFATLPYVEEQYGGDGKFPPVPAYTTAVTVAYLQDTPQGTGLRTQRCNMFTDLTSEEVVSAKYQERVGRIQDQEELFAGIVRVIPEFNYTIEGMKTWCMERVKREGLKVVAAHQVCQVPADNGVIDALVFPKCIMQDLPLIFRNQVVSLNPQLREIANSGVFPSLTNSILDEGIGPLLRGDAIIANLADAAAALILPPYTMFPTYREVTETPLTSSPEKEDRAARRRREREEKKRK